MLLATLALALLGLFGFTKLPAGELGAVRILEQVEVTPRWATGNPGFVAQIGVPQGLIRGIAFDLSGTTVTDSALNDDAPWTLVSQLKVTIPLKRGDVVIQSTGRDLYLLSRYLVGNLRENQTATTAGVTFSSFFLPFGPADWGIHSDALRPGANIVVAGTWAAVTEYGASTSDFTTGILRPSLYVDEAATPNPGRRALIPVTSRFAVESEARFPRQRLNKPELAEELFVVMYRQEDASVAGDRVDGLVSRLILSHAGLGDLHDQFFRTLRGSGAEWAGISPAEVTAALPLGLDGTALYVSAPTFRGGADLSRYDLMLTIDSAETVQAGVTNVTPAAGDALHATVVAMITPGP